MNINDLIQDESELYTAVYFLWIKEYYNHQKIISFRELSEIYTLVSIYVKIYSFRNCYGIIVFLL